VTASEENNDYFTLEHSTNGLDFTAVQVVEGAGNSQNTSTYHIRVADGKEYGYYRLTQTDYDGTTRIWKSIAVSCEEVDSDFSIYPNPAQGELSVLFNKEMNGEHTVVIYDILGRIVYSEVVNLDHVEELSINLENIAVGNFMVEIWSEETSKRIGVARMTKK